MIADLAGAIDRQPRAIVSLASLVMRRPVRANSFLQKIERCRRMIVRSFRIAVRTRSGGTWHLASVDRTGPDKNRRCLNSGVYPGGYPAALEAVHGVAWPRRLPGRVSAQVEHLATLGGQESLHLLLSANPA
jgi:hypothetical protein